MPKGQSKTESHQFCTRQASRTAATPSARSIIARASAPRSISDRPLGQRMARDQFACAPRLFKARAGQGASTDRSSLSACTLGITLVERYRQHPASRHAEPSEGNPQPGRHLGATAARRRTFERTASFGGSASRVGKVHDNSRSSDQRSPCLQTSAQNWMTRPDRTIIPMPDIDAAAINCHVVSQWKQFMRGVDHSNTRDDGLL